MDFAELYKNLDYDKVWRDFASSTKGKKPELSEASIVKRVIVRIQ